MDLINYGYSSSDEERSAEQQREDTNSIRSSSGQNNDEDGASSAHSSNDMEIETDSLGLDLESTPNNSVTTPQQTQQTADEAERPVLIYDDNGLPPSPSGECSEELKNRFIHLFKLKAQGVNMNAQILNRKEFKNPAIYDKLKSDYQVNEYGTNYPSTGKDHIELQASDYYDKLAEEQSKLMEQEEQLKKTPLTPQSQATSTLVSTSHSSRDRDRGRDKHSRFNKR